MNKFLKTSILCTLAAPLLVGCGGGNGGEKGPKLEDTVKRVVSLVGVAYGEYAQSSGISLAGADLIMDYELDDMKFTFDYTIAPMKEGYKSNYVQIEGTRLNVEIPTFRELNDDDGSQAVTYAGYILSASVKYAGAVEGKTENNKKSIGQEVGTGKWNIRVNAEEIKPVWEKLSQARTKLNGETVVTTGYVCAFMNNKDDSEYSNGVWLADGDAGMMLYGAALTAYFGSIKVGDMVMVIGTASPYNGLFEVKPTKLSIVTSSPEEVAAPNFKEYTEDQIKAFTDVNCSDPVTVKNCTLVSDPDTLKVASATAISLSIKFGNTTYTGYVNKHTNQAERQALVDHLKAHKGQPFTLKTVMGYNSGSFQFTIADITGTDGLVSCFQF